MNAGSISTSPRLRATLACLQSGEWVGGLAIQTVTRSLAVHSDVSALRAKPNCLTVETRRDPSNKRRYQYRLLSDSARRAAYLRDGRQAGDTDDGHGDCKPTPHIEVGRHSTEANNLGNPTPEKPASGSTDRPAYHTEMQLNERTA